MFDYLPEDFDTLFASELYKLYTEDSKLRIDWLNNLLKKN